MALWTSLLALIVGCRLACPVESGCSEKDKLVRKLTTGYLTSVEPDDTSIKIGIDFLCSRYDKTSGVLITNVWEIYAWTDTRLRWDPIDYGGIDILRIPSPLIWTPDFKLYNALNPGQDRDDTNTFVSPSGEVMWIPIARYETLCSNEQTGNGHVCDFKIGPWTYDSNVVKLEMDKLGYDLANYMNSTCPLSVEKATATIRTQYYPCCKEPYSALEINLHLRPSALDLVTEIVAASNKTTDLIKRYL